MFLLVNPGAVFIIIWVGLVFLFSLNVLTINVPLNVEAVSIVIINCLLAASLCFVFKLKLKVDFTDRIKIKLKNNLNKVELNLKRLLIIYFIISFFDVVYSGGMPLYWRLIGDSREYIDFGIPTVHGLANSILFFMVTMYVLLSTLGLRKSKLILFLLLAWQLIIFSRGTVMVMVVQMLAIYLFFTKFNIKKLFQLFIFGIGVIIFFGMSGDVRQGSNPYYGFVSEGWISTFDILPSGFLWVYVYLVSGFNNFLFNIELIQPSYLPLFTFAKLVPTVIYSLIGVDKSVDSFEFVNAGLNVSTIYSGFYSDFGIFAFLPVFIIQLLAAIAYVKAKGGNILWLLAFPVCYQAIVFSPFIDTFFYLPFIFQFVLIFQFRRCLK